MFSLIFSQLSDLIMPPNSMLKSHKFYPLYFELNTWGNGQSLFILFNHLAQYNGFGMEVVEQTTKLIPISFTTVRLTENHTKWWFSAFIAAILSENSYMAFKCQAKSFLFYGNRYLQSCWEQIFQCNVNNIFSTTNAAREMRQMSPISVS